MDPSQLVLINDPSSPKSYVFHEDVPPGGHIGVNPDGSATVYDATGKPVRQIAKPWAFDAAGRPQKTWYTVDENGDLVQHVEPAPNALYPLVGDPAVTDAGASGGAGSGQSAVSSLKSDSGMKASPSGSWGGDPGFSSGAASNSGGDPGFSAGGRDGLQDGGNDDSQHGSGSGGGGATGGDSGCEPGDCVGGGSDTPAPAPAPTPDPPSNTFTPAPTAPEESTGGGTDSQGGSGTADTGSETGGGGGSTSSGGASGAGGGGSSGDTTSTTGDGTDQVQPIDWTVPDRGDGGIFSGGIFGWWAAVQNSMAGLLQSFFEFIAAIMQWLKNLPVAIMTWLLSQAINGAEAFRHALQWLWDQLHIDNNNSPATPNNPPTNQTPSPPPATTEKPGENAAPGTNSPQSGTQSPTTDPAQGGNQNAAQKPPAIHPRVSNRKLQNNIDELYRGAKDPNRVGDGTTFDAVEWEQQHPGQTVGGKSHTLKLQERVNSINKILNTDKTLSQNDRDVANSLLDRAEKLGIKPNIPRAPR
ncbi:hypothetical protein [Gordonia polyisoprenivorans]|uniref:hypothetical protein n=1 Tax=Gordonia polyisoprenivorans TaxID=84595 RepID=UPI001AD6B7D0|nr:hypothetical protein [Gordonia polyisoprenivorans]QTI66732.1 hypothetical protein J6U32_13630 [Gordonia polyisoprenivorans]